jgi:putative acetyltransferase
MDEPDIQIQRATADDAPELARLFRRSFQSALPFLPTLHTTDEDRDYFSEHVLPKSDVFVARANTNQIIGFIAFDADCVNQLYLLPEHTGAGLGVRLLNIAKAQRSKLRLWAFKRNTSATNFYLKNGFQAIRETDGADNEEKEPDVLFEWLAAPNL